MGEVLTEIIIIVLLLVASGVFAMTEIAVVTARKGRLKRLAEQGDARARAALELAESPNRFLSTVQVGITLVGVLAGAFGGATVAKKIAEVLQSMPLLAPYGNAIGIGVVVVGITYLSLVIGELVPKRLALANPEGIARWMGEPMNRLANLASPLVRLLGCSTDFVLRLFDLKEAKPHSISEEEVKVLMQEGLHAGVFQQAETVMVESVLALDRLPVREIMTPRAKIIFLNKDDPHQIVWHKIVVSGHSNFPVYQANRDNVVGVVSVKAIYANLAANVGVKVADLMVPPLVVPATQMVVQLLETFRESGRHIALVAEEFGSIVGLVTLVDVLEAIAGDFPSQEERLKPQAMKRDDGSWLGGGLMGIEPPEQSLAGLKFPRPPARDFETLAGFVVTHLGRLPKEGETFDWMNYRFEVIDMDRHRVDKLLIQPLPAAAPKANSA